MQLTYTSLYIPNVLSKYFYCMSYWYHCLYDIHCCIRFGHKAHGKKHIRAPFICCYHPLPKNIHISNCTILFKMFSGQRMPKLYWPSPGILNLILWKCLTQRSSLYFFKNIFMPWLRINKRKPWFIRSTKISIRNTLTYFGILKLT